MKQQFTYFVECTVTHTSLQSFVTADREVANSSFQTLDFRFQMVVSIQNRICLLKKPKIHTQLNNKDHYLVQLYKEHYDERHFPETATVRVVWFTLEDVEWHSSQPPKHHSTLALRHGLRGRRGTDERGCSRQWRSLTAASTTASPIAMTYEPEPVTEVGAITSTTDSGVPCHLATYFNQRHQTKHCSILCEKSASTDFCCLHFVFLFVMFLVVQLN